MPRDNSKNNGLNRHPKYHSGSELRQLSGKNCRNQRRRRPQNRRLVKLPETLECSAMGVLWLQKTPSERLDHLLI
jgi:hypothetical protein